MTHFSLQNADNSIEMQLRWAGLKKEFYSAVIETPPTGPKKKINGANRNKTLAKEIKTSSRIWKKRVSGEQRVKGL